MNINHKKNSTRVAFFSDSLPERNGTGAYYYDLLSSLKSEIPNIEIFQPVHDVRFNLLSIPMPGDPSQKIITPNLFRIYKGLKKLKPKIIISVTPGPFGLVGYLYAKKHNLKFITAFHTNFEQLAKIYWNPFTRFFANLYLRSINKLLCQNSDLTLIHNSGLIQEMESLGSKHHKIMGTPLPEFYLEHPRKNPPVSIKQICYAGRLAAEKNIDLIIQAAAHFSHIKFVIIGEGPLRNKLKKEASTLKNVQFIPWLKREELVNMVDLSSALLLPSKIETFGSVAYEAMARGRPVIVAKNSGINEWESLSSNILQLENEGDLINSIQALINMSDEDRTKLSDNSYTAARIFHTKTIQQWIDLLTGNNE
ncbi:MAG: glycosyltransferase [Coraliomargaritaceae bacterium]